MSKQILPRCSEKYGSGAMHPVPVKADYSLFKVGSFIEPFAG